MASTSSQSKRCESETVPKRPVIMPRDIFDAAIKGDRDVLIGRLGLQTEEQTQIQEDGNSNHESTIDFPFGSEIIPLTQTTSPLATESNDSAPEKIRTENQTVRSELQSVTRSGEDTVLHLLVTKKHNELALMVFERDTSLLKMQNKMLETPLHCAAKVGNQEVIFKFIQMERSFVKDVLQKTNEKGDTALHVAAKYNFAYICCNLIWLDSELAYNVNKEMLSPFHIAIDEGYDFLAEQMLGVDPILACTQLTDGMFPVHLAARKNNQSMVLYFMENFPDYAELVDSHGRNLCHLVAEEADKVDFFHGLLNNCEDMTTRMNNATDYEGNTPLHIAAMKRHRHTMRSIWEGMTTCIAETIKNNRGLTPYEVSRNQIKEIWKESWRIESRIRAYEETFGDKFSQNWFMDVMEPPRSLQNKWERTQVIGLGSVLITTVTFTAAFTIPGGYNKEDHRTRLIHDVRWSFWAFILADTLAFIQGFISLLALLIGALPGLNLDTLEFSSIFFHSAANSMVLTFGFGLYVTLAPLYLPIATIIISITVFIGSPFLFIALLIALDWEGALDWKGKWQKIVTLVRNRSSLYIVYSFSVMFIIGLASLPNSKNLR